MIVSIVAGENDAVVGVGDIMKKCSGRGVVDGERNWLGFAKVGKTQHRLAFIWYLIIQNSYCYMHKTDPRGEVLNIVNIHGLDLADSSWAPRLNPQTSGVRY